MKIYLLLFSNYLKILTLIVLMAFIGSVVVSITVVPQLNIETSSCLFDTAEECIGAAEHVLQWQGTFNVFPEQNILLIVNLLLLVLGVFVLVTAPINTRYSLAEITRRIIFVRKKAMLCSQAVLFDYQRTLFSVGILHPKLFSS